MAREEFNQNNISITFNLVPFFTLMDLVKLFKFDSLDLKDTTYK